MEDPLRRAAITAIRRMLRGWKSARYDIPTMPKIEIGAKLLHFQIQAKLGQGGMGVVYQAWDDRLDRLVAIKVLTDKALEDPKRLNRFVQEAKDASALKHPNVITVHEIETAGEVTFIVMEYVEGATLDKIISKKRLRLADALKYAVQIADALKAAHRRHIVHCDLKPANIMITEAGIVKVLDFGLARLAHHERPPSKDTVADDAADPSRTTSMVALEWERKSISGTPLYMSPEQAQGEVLDGRSDIFSFGVILYEMLTGARPFGGKDTTSTLDSIVHQPATPARQVVAEVPPELERVVMRCLQKDPARRFQTAADLHVSLQELKEEVDSAPRAVTRPSSFRRLVWAWAVVVAGAALAAWGLWFKRPSEPVLQQFIVPVTTFAGSAQYPSFSPDGNQVAFSWDGGNDGHVDIYVKLLGDDAKPLRLTEDLGSNRYPAWSPTNSRIAFDRFEANRPAGIYSVSPLGRSEQKLTDFPSAGPISWSPDGKWLAASSNTSGQSGIALISLEGAELRRISSPRTPDSDTAPTFSRDGRSLAYIHCAGTYACDLFLQPLDSGYRLAGSPEQLTHQSMAIAGLAWSSDGRSLIYSASPVGRTYYLWRLKIHKGQPRQIDMVGRSAYWPSVASKGNRLVFSRLLRHFDIWRYQVGDGIDRIIASLELDQNSPQFSPQGDKIAFESNRSGVEEVWVAAADGSHEIQLTNQFGRHQGTPRWSPDGRWITFDSQGQDGQWDICVVDAMGGQPRRVTTEPSNENMPSWSRDGKWIYFTSDRTGRNEIWRVPSAGGQQEKITTTGAFVAFESADGKNLVYLTNNSAPLFVVPLSGGAEQQLLERVQSRAFAIADDAIYFIGPQGSNGRFPVELYRSSDRSTRVLTEVEGPIGLGLTVSPDRKTVLYTKSASIGARLDMIENFQ